MSFKGFSKKVEKQKQLRKINKIKKNLENTETVKQKAIYFGKKITDDWIKISNSIRLKSEQHYGKILIESRLLMIAALTDLLLYRAGIPGNTNEQLGNILQLITIFSQGQFYTEKLISEGQYVKASAVIKQEIEIIARITELKKGVAKDGRTPNVKYAPPTFNEHYGDMNNIAHISKPNILAVLHSIDGGTFSATSITPIFNGNLAKNLYEIHLIIFYNIIIESIELFQQLYPDDLELVLPACKILEIIVDYFKTAGIIKDNELK
ncbi:hypothetical protein VB711_25265 [Cronbergia sp. UHCC 0137]|uniref:hypothetical protein n=1 Tax=Cronbergia sp. UHCC 0137 TaxID=3110239 RepID=UPI002B207942|nr:hypothetical protein [Cronbergia sp. UHCC 0137]MEA5621118.1 hypothetical protein [Cronbergia sp. UHCC 0137]